MPKSLLAAQRFPLVRSKARVMSSFSKSSTASSRKNPLSSRWPTRLSNFSFILCLYPGHFLDALLQRVFPIELDLTVTSAKAILHFPRRGGDKDAGRADHQR